MLMTLVYGLNHTNRATEFHWAAAGACDAVVPECKEVSKCNY